MSRCRVRKEWIAMAVGVSLAVAGFAADISPSQKALLDDLTTSILPDDASKPDLYFLGIAGDGSQGVFISEVNQVRQFFDTWLGTSGRSGVLANAKELLSDTPMATSENIEYLMQAIAAKMDRQEDILFVYMTSHGSKDFEFSLNQPGIEVADLSAERIGEILSEVPVRWKVVVISACYSGGFIPYLQNRHTMVITAASADQPSFGCTDHNEYTWFGEAFFKDALPLSYSFVEAFDKAKLIVTDREQANEYEPSNPQIHKPEGVVRQLELWRAGLLQGRLQD